MKIYIPKGPGGGREKNSGKYKGRIVAVTTKGYIWLSDNLLSAIGNPQYVNVLVDEKTWGVTPCEGHEAGAYKLNTDQDDEAHRVRCASFIRDLNIPIGFVFEGRLMGITVYFSFLPTERA